MQAFWEILGFFIFDRLCEASIKSTVFLRLYGVQEFILKAFKGDLLLTVSLCFISYEIINVFALGLKKFQQQKNEIKHSVF